MIGNIHSIESFATLEGGGIRFAVFMQGCPLRCAYCHNPDTQSFVGGRQITAQEIVDKIKRNITFYKNGGVTISGGEPLAQSDFCLELSILVHEQCDLEIAIDTSGGVLPNNIIELIDNTDLFIVDLKFADDQAYISYTGHSINNTLLLLGMLNTVHKSTIIRSVILPGINDSINYIDKYIAIVDKYDNITEYELLGYHRMGVSKYDKLGIEYKLNGMPQMDSDKLNELQNYLNSKLKLKMK